MATPSSSAQALNAAAPSLAYNRLRLDALGSLEADSNGVTTNGGGNFLNNAGTTRVVGDVVIQDTTGDDRFTTTTTVADGRVLGVVNDASVANAVRGAVQTRGPAVVNVTGSVARGDYLVSSATVGLAQSKGKAAALGAFAIALEANSGGTVVALLFGAPIVGLPVNHSVNGLLDQWQRTVQARTANGPAGPDHIFISLIGTDAISCTQDTANTDTPAQFDLACVFTLGTGAGASGVYEQFKMTDNFRRWRGKTVSRAWRIRTATASAAKVNISSDGTGGGNAASVLHSGDGTWQTLVASYAVPSDASQVTFTVQMSASATIYVGAHSTVIGSIAADPYDNALSTADDLARCLRYYEKASGDGDANLLFSMNASGAIAYYWTFPFKVTKAVTPTVTKVGTWLATNCGQPSLSAGVTAVQVTITASGAGFMLSQNNAATTNITLEANP